VPRLQLAGHYCFGHALSSCVVRCSYR